MSGSPLPLISIVMAVYEPNMQWLEQQLDSLDSQNYPNIELLARDDCSPKTPFEMIERCFSERIKRFPYKLARNDVNLGSTKTFEKLTAQAGGRYIAYCDQDDVWMPDKLVIEQAILKRTGSALVCGDVVIIDGKGRQVADSIIDVRPMQIFRTGDGLAEGLIYRNFVIGCTMLIDAKLAKASIPFPDCMVHDHYLAFCCATRGRIEVAREKLVRYRIHEQSQTRTLAGVNTKEDYYQRRILVFTGRVNALSSRFTLEALAQAEEWAKAREDYYIRKCGAARRLWRLRKQNLPTSLFELAMPVMPQWLFRLIINSLRRDV